MTDEKRLRRPVHEWPGVGRVYRRIQARFRDRRGEYGGLRDDLAQAHLPTTYDEYLARSATYAVLAGVTGVVLGAVVASLAFQAGLVDVSSPVPLGELGYALEANAPVLTRVLGAIAGGVVVGYLTWMALLGRPASIAAARRRQIDVTLPHAIVYLYALSHGGMNLVEAMRSLAEAEEAYGEVAREFDRAVEDMEYFGTDLPTALRNLQEATPSDNLDQFLDDLLTVVDTGGDPTSFFENESDRYLGRARDEQREFLEFLSLIAEMYITLLVAGPLFLIILLLVISMLSGSAITQVYAIIYAGIPLLSTGLVIGLDVVSAPFAQTGWQMSGRTRPTPPDVDDPVLARYRRRKRIGRWKDLLCNPGRSFARRPALSVLVTLPVAAGVLWGVLSADLASLDPSAFTAAPVATTVLAVLLPFAVVTVPFTVLYERRRGRNRRIQQRFPDVLSMLSNANETGFTLAESFDLVADRDTSALSGELRKIRNDVEWNGDLGMALVAFANRVRVPVVSRTVKLLVESNRSSSDLRRILDIAAEDATSHERLKQERYREITAYVAVVVVAFFVFLGILALLDVFFLDTFAEQANPDPEELGTPTSFQALDVGGFRVAFFHASLVQALFGGLIVGKMSHNEVAAGLKYSLALMTLSVVVFAAL